jgi:hypothetical protein
MMKPDKCNGPLTWTLRRGRHHISIYHGATGIKANVHAVAQNGVDDELLAVFGGTRAESLARHLQIADRTGRSVVPKDGDLLSPDDMVEAAIQHSRKVKELE